MKNIYVVDLTKDSSKTNLYFSNTLLSKIQTSLDNDKKVILYINRRGEYSSLICQDCQHLYKCDKCDISLSVHKNPALLMCHICGTKKNIDMSCVKCGGTNLKKVGIGTQQVENVISKIFSDKNIFRLDTDNIKTIKGKKEAMNSLHNADIIIGTKMITTGFDFARVGLIGVVLLDQGLSIPKYNTEEKLYFSLKQLIGRGGRLGVETDIVIQTFIPNNQIIKNIIDFNYKEFFISTLQERKLFGYPPFKENVSLIYKNKNKEKSYDFMRALFSKLDNYNLDKKYTINIIPVSQKRNNLYITTISIIGQDIRDFLQNIKTEIFKNNSLNVIFN